MPRKENCKLHNCLLFQEQHCDLPRLDKNDWNFSMCLGVAVIADMFQSHFGRPYDIIKTYDIINFQMMYV